MGNEWTDKFASEFNTIRERLNLTEKQAAYLGIVSAVVLLFIIFSVASSIRASRKNLGRINMAQQNPVGLACPPGGCVRTNPVALTAAQPNNERFISGGQYVCSKCGNLSLPDFDTAGTPHCPICGSMMKVNGVGDGQPTPAR